MKMAGDIRKETPLPRKEALAFADKNPVADAAAAQPFIGQGHKILVVDDNPVILKAFEMKLRSLGLSVLTTMEGSQAVNHVTEEHPDLVVLDINFQPPGGSGGLQWDGFSIMQWLQRFEEAARIPVIIITGADPELFRQRALDAGAVAFFHKPINLGEFLAAVRLILSQSAAKAQAA
jgi:DNA-binding response OmpR family regulator